MAAWSQLPDDIWGSIGEKLRIAVDRIRFRSVCKTWRCLLPFPQPPWLILAEDDDNPRTRGFVGLGQPHQQQKEGGGSCFVYQFEVPEIYRTKTVGSKGTWLVTVDLQFRIRLLNPFSRVQVQLPPLTTLDVPDPQSEVDPEFREPGFYRNYYLRKAVLSSSNPLSVPGDCIVVAIYQTYKLAYARPGDASWKDVIIPTNDLGAIRDLTFYQGHFYGISMLGIVLALDLGNPNKITRVCDKFNNISTNENVKYLVECAGELLSVVKFLDHEFDNSSLKSYRVNRFEVYKLDFPKKKWTQLKDLGDYCLFLGLNTSVALSVSSNQTLQKNCIYFTDDYPYMRRSIPRGRAMGVFDIEDNNIRPHYRGTSTSFYAPPLWMVP